MTNSTKLDHFQRFVRRKLGWGKHEACINDDGEDDDDDDGNNNNNNNNHP